MLAEMPAALLSEWIAFFRLEAKDRERRQVEQRMGQEAANGVALRKARMRRG